ncbi:MAG: GyrI-like domain-containing protein [Bacteroidota bacterium]
MKIAEEPSIETLAKTHLIGKKVRMSFANNRTQELWQNFMPRRAAIKNTSSQDLYSVEVYDNPDFFQHFNPTQEFEKWAAVQISSFGTVPDGMETLVIPEGLYAVFHYQGKASEVAPAYQYIYGSWIPNSDYVLDHRPHFALMGEQYKNDDPNSQEELWIPIKKRS